MEWKYESGRIYSVDENNELVAEVTYVFAKNGVVNINHTYVNPQYRGKGIAGKLMETMVEYLRKNSLKTIAQCSYANSWFKKHRELYSDVISEEL